MSGFTVFITGNTLNFWLTKEGVDVRTIGIFALVSLPYAINFIWAPIFDLKTVPGLAQMIGHRSSWIILIQLFLSLAVYLLGLIIPSENLFLFAVVAIVVSFLSSAQDTVLGALRAEIVGSNKQGQVSGIYVFGYRIGMILSSSVAIYISSYIGWNLVYQLFSVVILLFPVIILLLTTQIGETTLIYVPNKILLADKSRDVAQIRLKNWIKMILQPLGTKKYLIMILAFLVLYRLPDNFITTMINPFLIKIGYEEFEISTAGKFFGISAAIIGGIMAGFIMKRLDVLTSLLFFGALHGFGHLLFIIQDIYGKNIYLLFLVTGFESITGGMAMAAYIGYITSLCRGRFKATQYSFLTSMMGFSRSVLPTVSGYIVSNLGWKSFYFFTSLATIPALILIVYLRKHENREQQK